MPDFNFNALSSKEKEAYKMSQIKWLADLLKEIDANGSALRPEDNDAIIHYACETAIKLGKLKYNMPATMPTLIKLSDTALQRIGKSGMDMQHSRMPGVNDDDDHTGTAGGYVRPLRIIIIPDKMGITNLPDFSVIVHECTHAMQPDDMPESAAELEAYRTQDAFMRQYGGTLKDAIGFTLADIEATYGC